jgi:hypothetical protein
MAAQHASAGTLRRQRRRARGARLLAGLLAGLLGVGLMGLAGAPASPTARAAPNIPHILTCAGPCVGITRPRLPNNTSEGPVGTHLTVEGAGWPAGSLLTIWPGATQAACAQPPASDAKTLNVDGAGNAAGSYDWPADANQVGHSYTLCANDNGKPATATANAPSTFLVLAAQPPLITASSSTLTPGDAVIVNGQNWLPAQPLTVNICPNSSDTGTCASPIASLQLGSNADGTFQAQLTIPPDASVNTYYIVAANSDGTLTAPPAGNPVQITVSNPTPTPTLTPIPTATPRPTPTPTPGGASGGKGGTIFLVIMLGMFSLLFLIGGFISMAVYLRGSP